MQSIPIVDPVETVKDANGAGVVHVIRVSERFGITAILAVMCVGHQKQSPSQTKRSWNLLSKSSMLREMNSKQSSRPLMTGTGKSHFRTSVVKIMHVVEQTAKTLIN